MTKENDPIGKAILVINKKEFPVDVYGYKKYRSVFINDKILKETGKNVKELPSTAHIKNYLGRWSYEAKKFGNPHNKIPTYDFQVNHT